MRPGPGRCVCAEHAFFAEHLPSESDASALMAQNRRRGAWAEGAGGERGRGSGKEVIVHGSRLGVGHKEETSRETALSVRWWPMRRFGCGVGRHQLFLAGPVHV